MQALEILCLASSIKFGGRCVAGVRLDTGEWVRPVSDTPDGTLPRRQCVVDGVTVKVCPVDVPANVRGLPETVADPPEVWVVMVPLKLPFGVTVNVAGLPTLIDPGPARV